MASGRNDTTKQAYIYLFGHALLTLGLIFFTVGFATDHWLTTEYGRYGLWNLCAANICATTSSTFTSWMLATRAMQTMALICYMVSVLLALSFHCITQTSLPARCVGNARVLEVFVTIGNVLCLIGVWVYGSKGDERGTLEYSYALSVFSLFLSTPGIVMVAVTRNTVTNNNASVTPQRQLPTDGASPSTTATTITSAQYPQQSFHHDGVNGFGQSGQNGRQYPYGRGQHDPGTETDGGFGVSYPYGGGGGPTPQPAPPYTSQRHLPYPIHRDGPGTMPEPGPVGGDGGGGGGGGGAYNPPIVGQPRSPGRLPPITDVNPSAPPPPPPDEFDQPPSYMEAIGHRHP